MNDEAVLQSLEALRGHLDRHERLIRGERPGASAGEQPCGPHGCPHRQRLCRMLLEIAAVLESTRRAFRSPRLEALRRECLRIVAEEAGGVGRNGEPHAAAARTAGKRTSGATP